MLISYVGIISAFASLGLTRSDRKLVNSIEKRDVLLGTAFIQDCRLTNPRIGNAGNNVVHGAFVLYKPFDHYHCLQ